MDRTMLQQVGSNIKFSRLRDADTDSDFIYVENISKLIPLTKAFADQLLDELSKELGHADTLRIRALTGHNVDFSDWPETIFVAIDGTSSYYQELAIEADIRLSNESDTNFVEECYREALRRGYDNPINSAMLEQEIERVIQHEARLTFIAENGGRQIGHITLLPDSLEDESGLPATELSDVFVIPGESLAVINQLTRVGLEHRPKRGQRVVATVVHHDPERAQQITELLLRKGWSRIYDIWKFSK